MEATPEQAAKIDKLRQDIRQMFQLQKAKPEMTVLVMGEERESVSWEEAEDDLSLGIARYVVLDFNPPQPKPAAGEKHHLCGCGHADSAHQSTGCKFSSCLCMRPTPAQTQAEGGGHVCTTECSHFVESEKTVNDTIYGPALASPHQEQAGPATLESILKKAADIGKQNAMAGDSFTHMDMNILYPELEALLAQARAEGKVERAIKGAREELTRMAHDLTERPPGETWKAWSFRVVTYLEDRLARLDKGEGVE